MLKRIPKLLRLGLGFGLLALCVVQTVRAATAAPLTVPVDKDKLKAERTAVSRVGGVDAQQPMAPEGKVVGGNGVIEPSDRETRVAAQATAVVKAVLVSEGQQVDAGAPLVQLNDDVEAAALQAVEADLASERASLARTLKGQRVEDREAAEADAAGARARAALSLSVAERTDALFKTGAATKDEVERARRTAQSDAALAQGTEARLRAAVAGSRNEDVAVARARVLSAEARVAQARAQLDRLLVRAPISGEVLQVKTRAGELYSPGGEPLLIMGNTAKLRVRMDVDERDVAKVKVGAHATARADAFGDRVFAGTVVELGKRFGRKNVRTDDPTEKNDTKILEVVIELDANQGLVVGQRVVAFVDSSG